MKRILLSALFLTLAAPFIANASDVERIPQFIIEEHKISSQLPASTSDIDYSTLSDPDFFNINSIADSQENLSHKIYTQETDNKIMFQSPNIINLYDFSNIADTRMLPGQRLAASNTSDSMPSADKQVLIAQSESEDISHTALKSAVQPESMFYYVKISGAVPLFDESFRELVDYGAAISLGAGKHINENLSLSVSLDVLLLTGDWSISGDRKSIEVAAEEWATGIVNSSPNNGITPEAEDQPDVNLGTSYHSDAEATITSSESLKKIDLHTDLYTFPITLNALYKLNKIGKINPYIGGGLGYCVAIRDSDSNALKSKYFNGPEYSISMSDRQTRTGMLLNILGGIDLPVYKSLTFIAEGNLTYYDIKSFDPILEISFKTPSNPSNLGGNDVATWSNEDPKQIGMFSQEFVGKFTVGLVMPF